MELKNKVVVVTGAGSGIGRAVSVNAAKLGASLAISDVQEEGLNETQKIISSLGQPVHAQLLDVRQWEDFLSYGQTVNDHFGQVDVVINNAGVALGSFSVEEVTMDQFHWLMDINFWGMVHGSKAFLPFLKLQKEACLVNISSILGLAAISKQAPYCASKFAIRGFTESLRMEAALDFPHVTILSVHPGGIQTNIARNAEWGEDYISAKDKERLAAEFEKTFINTPDYAANDILKAIQKKKKRLLIGSDARKIWRIVRWFPVGYTKILVRSFLKELQAVDSTIERKKKSAAS